VELRSRFDEGQQHQMDAPALKENGVNVIYGMVGVKFTPKVAGW